MTRRAGPLVPVLTTFALVLAACGGGGGSATTGGAATGGGGGGETLLAADPGGALKFDQTSLSASAGNVTIDFTNDSSLAHNVTVEGNGVEDEATDTIKQSSATLTLDLKPGTYTFYCSVDGHRAAGMEGTLVVK
ncbi:MAG TPA: plastocyanin/azurin family copper-binding protein [Gaiellaceae bacterium]|jgi:plastocyanin